MRILNSTAVWGMTIAAMFVYFLFVATAPAEATRPVPGFKYKDECKNIKGKQPIYLLVGTGPYRFNLDTKRPNDCIRVNRPRVR